MHACAAAGGTLVAIGFSGENQTAPTCARSALSGSPLVIEHELAEGPQ